MATPEEFQQEWVSGDREKARAMASEYVSAHALELEPWRSASIEETVALVTHFRNAGEEQSRIIADMALLAWHAPQQITGTALIGGAAAVAMAEAIIAEARSL